MQKRRFQGRRDWMESIRQSKRLNKGEASLWGSGRSSCQTPLPWLIASANRNLLRFLLGKSRFYLGISFYLHHAVVGEIMDIPMPFVWKCCYFGMRWETFCTEMANTCRCDFRSFLKMVVQVKFWAIVGRWGASERFGCRASISLECVFCSLAFGGLFCYLRMLRVPQLKNSSKMR